MVWWTESQKSTAGTIGAILDMDSYRLNGKCLVKELGWTPVRRDGHAISVHFYYRGSLKPDRKDRGTNEWIYRHVFDIPFTAYWFGMIGCDKLSEVVRSFYVNDGSVVAYKGGHYEKDLLASLGIPCVNLEDLGCPKVDVIRSEAPAGIVHEVPQCGHHRFCHCPMEEVRWMHYWLSIQASRNRVTLKEVSGKNPFHELSIDCFACCPHMSL